MSSSGRVLQVNVSGGGVPKTPVQRAWIGRLGVDGDSQRGRTIHGGPHRAVCLYGIEAIERLQSEGHPVEPGGVGENLTTAGIEWSLLPVGTRARIGRQVLLELASPVQPCATQKPNFRDGRFSRIAIAHHPSDSRMYARVIDEGEVATGDPIEIEPPLKGSRAKDELLLGRLDRAAARADLVTWRALQAAGHAIHIVDDGELVMAAAPDLPGPELNCAFGLARMPQLLADVRAFYDRHGVTGWLVTEAPPWPDAVPETTLGVFSAHVGAVAQAPEVEGLVVESIGPAGLSDWERVHRASGGRDSSADNARRRTREQLLGTPHVSVVIARLDAEPVGSAVLTTVGGVGWLRGGNVVPAARGRGIQRALIAARASIAATEGCDVVGVWAEPGTISARNVERMGLRQVGMREQHPYRPTTSRA